jgi:hypothetical protein
MPLNYYTPPYSDIYGSAKPQNEAEISGLGTAHVVHKIPSPAAADTSDHAIDESDGSLRELSLQIHGRLY